MDSYRKSTLADLIAPFPFGDFLEGYWGKKPLFLKGEKARIAEVFNRPLGHDELIAIARDTANGNHGNFRLYASSPPEADRETRKPLRAVKIDEVESILQSSSSLLLENLRDAVLQQFTDSCKKDIGHIGPVQIRSTITPKGGIHPPHIDATCSLFVHCEGRKRFTISPRPVLEFPMDAAVVTANGELSWNNHQPEPWEAVSNIDEGSFIEYVMEPGDVLYFPAGTVHATESLSDICAGVNFQFVHTPTHYVILEALRRSMTSNVNWRRIPAIPTRGEAGHLDRLSIYRHFMSERLEELSEAVASIKPEDF
ncbi:cupin domain-containing protein [Streptomyces sp. NPDC005805]|uniref:JmjC domain-containing protein n=1 Tax=Streptomyces sp. NPDC005805 TaxID=3157068 RepID=UPI003411E690